MVMAMFPIFLVFAVFLLPQRLINLFLLLFDQEILHRIVVVVLFDQFLQFHLLLNHGPPPRLLRVFGVLSRFIFRIYGLASRGLLLSLDVGPADGELGRVLVVAGLVPRVVDADQAPRDLGAAEVVHREVAAPLVLVLQPAEPFALPRLLVPRELEEHGLPVLREDGDHVALRQLVGEAAEVHEGRVAVVCVPGCFGGYAILDFALVERLDGADLVHDWSRMGCICQFRLMKKRVSGEIARREP